MKFETPIAIDGGRRQGPTRQPEQLLQEQVYDGHKSIHDGEMADKLGLAGAPIEGPTHFSQIDPLAVDAWGQQWFENGCISAHFRGMVMEGEMVQAALSVSGQGSANIEATKTDGTPVLVGTATIDPNAPTALRQRLAQSQASDPGPLYIVDTLKIGERFPSKTPQSIDMDSRNGDLYPFSLRRKLDTITEHHPWYESTDNPWGRAILPFEMYSVLVNKHGRAGTVRGPSSGLFVDLEVRAINSPLFVGQPYLIEKEVLAVDQSRRVEGYWTESRIHDADSGALVATVLLHQGVFKASYADYPADKLVS